jgi:hypothetical protein
MHLLSIPKDEEFLTAQQDFEESSVVQRPSIGRKEALPALEYPEVVSEDIEAFSQSRPPQSIHKKRNLIRKT